MLSFETLFRENIDYVWRIARMSVGDGAADDVVQEVFLVARKRLRDFEGTAVRGWLYTITRNVARNYVRGRTRRLRLVQSAPPRPPALALDELIAHGEAAEFIEHFLHSLTPAKRDAFMLHVIEGLPAKEAAEALEIPTRTVYSRVRAAWAELEARVQRNRVREGLA